MGNHWNDDGDLVIEDRTLFRQVGWSAGRTTFYPMDADVNTLMRAHPGGLWPIFQQIATDHGEGWEG
jgi:hypothetical protein